MVEKYARLTVLDQKKFYKNAEYFSKIALTKEIPYMKGKFCNKSGS
ncbi:hypothetical protein PITCH_A1900009 [uncultured Desulfobacterium sp.]|uniref:Uncharacterized protein n=1 Tax=uncultured Desulfobacterium sp. TaxID=201089 RepID=A0A445MVW9_9BACT|nr:hypothetical protein PITCH_A1900009 [uncultured Desulfobacterium sp.]